MGDELDRLYAIEDALLELEEARMKVKMFSSLASAAPSVVPSYDTTISSSAPKKNMDYYLAYANKNLYQTQTVIKEEVKPDYMDEDTYKAYIKREIIAQMNDALMKKVVFTSQKRIETFETVVRGRIYMFNQQELVDLIKECLKV